MHAATASSSSRLLLLVWWYGGCCGDTTQRGGRGGKRREDRYRYCVPPVVVFASGHTSNEALRRTIISRTRIQLVCGRIITSRTNFDPAARGSSRPASNKNSSSTDLSGSAVVAAMPNEEVTTEVPGGGKEAPPSGAGDGGGRWGTQQLARAVWVFFFCQWWPQQPPPSPLAARLEFIIDRDRCFCSPLLLPHSARYLLDLLALLHHSVYQLRPLLRQGHHRGPPTGDATRLLPAGPRLHAPQHLRVLRIERAQLRLETRQHWAEVVAPSAGGGGFARRCGRA